MFEFLTKKQKKNIDTKWQPKPDREYLVTDDCFWKQNPPQDYNFSDPERKPHYITLVDKQNGSVVRLPSGSVIRIVSTVDHG